MNKGLVVEEPGRRYEKGYKEHLWENYNKYSHEDTEILIEVQPKYVEVMWKSGIPVMTDMRSSYS